jgi:hypothetical protein
MECVLWRAREAAVERGVVEKEEGEEEEEEEGKGRRDGVEIGEGVEGVVRGVGMPLVVVVFAWMMSGISLRLGIPSVPGPLTLGFGWKCAKRRAENRSPTPEKYPGIRGTHWACTMDGRSRSLEK